MTGSGLTLYDEFAGWGGSSQGAAAVPGVELVLAANHAEIAVAVHAQNFPAADHYLGDVTKADLTRFPRTDLFWASPACPPWTDARGKRRDFDKSTQGVLFGPGTDVETAKRRALMEEVPRYLRAMADRGDPVLAGVVENVVQVAKWDQLRRWIREIETAAPAGYTVRVIALNSMHAQPVRTARAPQSRDRFFAAYILNSIGRRPDWDKWLRPRAWCPTCDQQVTAVQVFKQPGAIMGRYGIRHGQYVYRCPHVHGAWRGSHRPGVVEPEVLPAAVAIDWTRPAGARIGERVDAKGRPDPLEPATIARIEAGLRKFTGQALLAPAGGTWRQDAYPVTQPMPARTTRDCDGVLLPPLLVPTTARDRSAYLTGGPLRTQTTRQETALVTAPTTEPVSGPVTVPFLASLRGGGSKSTARGIDEPLLTFSAEGTHHALIQRPVTQPGALVMRNNSGRRDGAEMSTPVGEPLRTLTTRGHQPLITWDTPTGVLVPYYSNGTARPFTDPIGAFTTKDRWSLVTTGTAPQVAVEDCTFRMLAPAEIGAGMAFARDYRVKGTNREQVAGYGNAVTPPCAEVIISALVEAITGQHLPR